MRTMAASQSTYAARTQEAQSDDPEGAALGGLASGLVGIIAEPPQGREAAGDFDGGIEAKADEGDAAGHEPGGQRHEALGRVPRDREVLERAPELDGAGAGEDG